MANVHIHVHIEGFAQSGAEGNRAPSAAAGGPGGSNQMIRTACCLLLPFFNCWTKYYMNGFELRIHKQVIDVISLKAGRNSPRLPLNHVLSLEVEVTQAD
uniref:Uncharacterized protein n=1 Tax=Nelumbo nucifera TaxID=4432 RepID=A0A822YIW0_NELNU|nr:TPA_asm: hypothetical protein HUJ06_009707 [Nelumbo nucifera]